MAAGTLTDAGPGRAVPGAGALWFGVLAGPVLWAAQLVVNYQWEEVLACSPGTTRQAEVLGLDVRTWILLVNAAVTAVVLAALAVSVRSYRRTGATEEGGVRTTDHHRSVAHWMAFAGMANGVLFLLLIVGQFGPPLLLQPCQPGR